MHRGSLRSKESSVWELVERQGREAVQADMERLEQRRANFEQRLAAAISDGSGRDTILMLRSGLADVIEQLHRATICCGSNLRRLRIDEAP